MLVVGVIVVAFLLLGAGKAKAAPTPPPERPPEPRNRGDVGAFGGGTDWGKVVPTVAGTVGSAVTLGGTILAAVGGHGAAAAGAGAAGTGTAAGATLVETGGGTAQIAAGGGTAGGAAESTLDAFAVVSVGSAAAEAAVVGGIAVLVALAMLEMYMAEQVGVTRNYWARASNKPLTYYSRWFNYEETAVQSYLEALSKARGGDAVAHTKQYADVIYGSDGSQAELHRYYVDSVQDPQALRELPMVRQVARWFAIEREYAYHRAVLMFWASIGRPPGVTDTGDVGDIAAGTNAAQPAMTEEAFWQLAGDYLSTQPFAQVRYSGDRQTVVVPNSKSGGVALGGTSSSYQPQGQLPEKTFEALAAKAGALLGPALDATKFQAYVRGSAHGMTLAAVTGYQLLYPGDDVFTIELGRRCGFPWHMAPVRTAANQIRFVLFEPSKRYGIDVALSRFKGTPVIYGPEALQ